MPRSHFAGTLYFDKGDAVNAAAREPQVAVRSRHHVSHYASARRDDPRLEFLRLSVKAHDRIRLGVRFAIPEDIPHRCDAVRSRARSARRGPLGNFARLWIEPPQVAARIVGIPNHIVWSNGHASWMRIHMRQHVFADGQRVRIEAGYLVASK